MTTSTSVGTPIAASLAVNPIRGEISVADGGFLDFMNSAMSSIKKNEPSGSLLAVEKESSQALLAEETGVMPPENGDKAPVEQALIQDVQGGALLAKDAGTQPTQALAELTPEKTTKAMRRLSGDTGRSESNVDNSAEETFQLRLPEPSKEVKIDNALKQAGIVGRTSPATTPQGHVITPQGDEVDSIALVLQSRQHAQSLKGNVGAAQSLTPQAVKAQSQALASAGQSTAQLPSAVSGKSATTTAPISLTTIKAAAGGIGGTKTVKAGQTEKVFDSKEIERIKDMLKNLRLNDKKIAEGEFKVKEGVSMKMKADPAQKTMTLDFSVADQVKAVEIKGSIEQLAKQLEGVGYRIQTVTLNGEQMQGNFQGSAQFGEQNQPGKEQNPSGSNQQTEKGEEQTPQQTTSARQSRGDGISHYA